MTSRSSMRSIEAISWVVFALVVATLALGITTLAIIATRPAAKTLGDGGSSLAPQIAGGAGSQTPQLAGGLGGAMNPSRIDGPLALFPTKGIRGNALTPQQLQRHAASSTASSTTSSTSTTSLHVVDGAAAKALIDAPKKSVVFVMQPGCPACVRTKDALTRVQRSTPALTAHVAILDVRQLGPVSSLLTTNAVPQAFIVGGQKVERGMTGAPRTDDQLTAFLRSATA
jgi:hypothetical protein